MSDLDKPTPSAAEPPPWPSPVPMPAPRPVTVWSEDVWPALKGAGAPPAALAGALIAGVVAAIALRLDVPGIGYLLTGLAILATAFGTLGRRPEPMKVAWAVATVALLVIGTVRAVEWLFVLAVAAALITGTLALVGGASWRALFTGLLGMPLVQFRTWLWSGRGLGRLVGGRTSLFVRVTAVVLVSLALLLVFGGLFYGADSVFAGIVDAGLPDFAIGNLIGNAVLGAVVTGVALSAACLAHIPPRFDNLAHGEPRPLRRWEWAVPLGVLNALFAVFVAIQLAVLFGHAHERLHRRLDFAAYAREGFYQLLWVTILTLVVLAIANRKAGRAERGDRVLVRMLLGGLSALTLVIVASAVVRLVRFETDFGFTGARLFLHTVELWLGAVFVLIMIAGVRLRAAWLPRAVVGSAVIAIVALAALNPDHYIATRNVERFTKTHKIDVTYLGTLSADAVPALQRLPDPERSCALTHINVHGAPGGDRWYTYNAGRVAARASLEHRPLDDGVRCPVDRQWPNR